MKIFKNIINIILSFLLLLLILVNIALNIVKDTILNKDYVLSKMEETEFYLQISREIQSGFENYIYQSGLPENTIEDLFTEEIIREDVNSIVNFVYDGTDITTSEDKIVANLDNKIDAYVEEQGLKLNTQGQENIENFEEIISKEYVQNINVSSTLYEYANEGISTLNKAINAIGNIPIIITIIVIVLLLIINIKDLLWGLNFGFIAVFASGILMYLGQHIIFKNFDIDNIMVLATSISNVLINIVKEILYKIKDMGTYFIVIGFAGILIVSIVRNLNFGNKKDKEKIEKGI